VVRALDETGRIVFAGAANGSGYRLAPAIASQAVDLLHFHRTEGVTGDHHYV
jgi:D-arginine dehydrogenase